MIKNIHVEILRGALITSPMTRSMYSPLRRMNTKGHGPVGPAIISRMNLPHNRIKGMFLTTKWAAVGQRRRVAQFRVDPRFKKGKGFLHYAFKTKAVIDKEETERMAAEWNEWDLESLVRYKNMKSHNERNNKEEVEAKRELRMKLRIYASDTFRGGMPKPMEMKMLKELQGVPPIMAFDDNIKGQDLTTLDMRLLLKYISPSTVPRPLILLEAMFKANHVFDDYSCGHFFTLCRMRLKRIADFKFGDEASTYKDIQQGWAMMREREGGHRCTLHQFAYSQYIKICADMHDMDTVLIMKQDLLDRNLPLNASVYEGIIQCAVDIGRSDIALAEWREMHDRYALAPTIECSRQMLRYCEMVGDYETGKQIWEDVHTKYLQKGGIELYNAMIKLCSATGNTKQAFYHYYEMLEYTDIKPTLETCNALLEGCSDLKDAAQVMKTIDSSVLETNDTTFNLLFRLCGKMGSLDTLLEYWDKMQDQRVRPSVDTLHGYLQALADMPRDDDAYHPAELLAKGLAAYDWAGRNTIFDSTTFLLLLHLCAKSGQHQIARVLFRKMVLTDIPFFPQHVAAMIAIAANSDSAFPLKDVEGLLMLAETRFEGTPHHYSGTAIMALHFLLTHRKASTEKEPDHQERVAKLWQMIEGRIGEGVELEENRKLIEELREEVRLME